MKSRILACLCFFVVLSTYAEVSDSVWKALLNRDVIIEKSDGSEVTGKLTSFDDLSVVVIKADGKVVSVQKKGVSSVRVNTAGEAPAQETKTGQAVAADAPLKSAYFLADPLGFLQAGPTIELGFRVAPNTLFGIAGRFEGLGVLAQVLGSFELSPTTVAVEAMLYQLFPTIGRDRWYVMAAVGYTFGASAGDVGTSFEWKSNWSNVEVGAGGGYRWRFPGDFFLDVGALAGAAIGLGGKWYYLSSPSTTYTSSALTTIIGMLQLHLGWEL